MGRSQTTVEIGLEGYWAPALSSLSLSLSLPLSLLGMNRLALLCFSHDTLPHHRPKSDWLKQSWAEISENYEPNNLFLLLMYIFCHGEGEADGRVSN